MIDFRIVHTGNRGIFWTDMESSRFLLKDDGKVYESFYERDLQKFSSVPTGIFEKKTLRLSFSFTINSMPGMEIITFSDKPSWFAAKGDILLILELLKSGSNYTYLKSITTDKSQLDLLLAILQTKGLMGFTGNVNLRQNNFFECDDIMLLEATKRCNLTCKHCFNNSEFALPNENSTNELKRYIDYLVALKTGSNLVISGGEPLTRKDIFLLIDYAVERGLSVELLTNGMIISEDIIAKLKHYKVKVRVSLDGFSQETHEFLRGPGTFTKTVANIIRMVQAGITTGITTSFSSHNIHEVDLLEAIIEKTNVDFFQYIIMNQLGRAIPNNITNSDDALLFMKFHEIISRNHRVRHAMRNSTLANIIAGNSLGLFFYHCGVGLQTNYYIQSDGDVFPCRAMIQPEFKIGNIKESFVMNHERLAFLRSLEVDSLNPICSACNFRYWCSGECRGENYLITGSLTSPTTYCDELIDGFTTCLYLTAKDPYLYYEKTDSFLERSNQVDFITELLSSENV